MEVYRCLATLRSLGDLPASGCCIAAARVEQRLRAGHYTGVIPEPGDVFIQRDLRFARPVEPR
jgi:hypothetical protein